MWQPPECLRRPDCGIEAAVGVPEINPAVFLFDHPGFVAPRLWRRRCGRGGKNQPGCAFETHPGLLFNVFFLLIFCSMDDFWVTKVPK